MRAFVAGATGAIGRPLVQQLREAGHEVVGTTRSEERAQAIRSHGAKPIVLDVRDTDALRQAVAEAEPEVVINQLTALPGRLNYRKPDITYGPTNELRGTVGPALAGAAAESGARRLISQSVCFFYLASGKSAHSEEDPILELPPGSAFAPSLTALAALESATLETPGLDGVVLRYGYYYGPGTHYAPDGFIGADLRRRRFPIVGKGTGVFSFVHIDDAASATVAALDGPAGVYNVCDDDPAPMSEWLPAYAEAIGAKRPWRAPTWLARLVAGKQAALLATQLEGASNARAKRELGWQPRYPSWRQGFREALG
jgi:nucleoside-diphosphate-sugar epimerase